MAEKFNKGYALLIGVGRYKQKNLTVMQAAYDAEDLQNLLIDAAYCGYLQEQVTVLSNEQATQAAIVTALQTLADNIVDKQATVIIMFSGHGYNQDGMFYFLPHDTKVVYADNGKFRGIESQSAISNEVLVNQIRTISQRANKTLVIFHSCHAGGMGTAFGLDNDDDLIEQLRPISFEVFDTSYQDLAHGKGTVILASSQQSQESWAFGSRNSLFMERVLAVLKGEGIATTEKYVELLPFIDVVKKSVRTIAEQRGKQQDPDYRVYGGMEGDFRIALRLGGQAMGIESTPIKPAISSAAKRITGIPPQIYNEMRQVLLDCALFSTFKELREIFANERISLWRNGLPTADSYEGLIQAVMAYLHLKMNTDDENGLVLFLEVLLNKVDPKDKCHQKLKAVAQSFELAVSGGGSGSFGVTAQAETNSNRPIKIRVLHELLINVFNPASLDRFLRDSQTAAFQKIRNNFGFGMGLNDMVDQVIDYCQRYVLLEQLLTEVKAENPGQYALYENQLY